MSEDYQDIIGHIPDNYTKVVETRVPRKDTLEELGLTHHKPKEKNQNNEPSRQIGFDFSEENVLVGPVEVITDELTEEDKYINFFENISPENLREFFKKYQIEYTSFIDREGLINLQEMQDVYETKFPGFLEKAVKQEIEFETIPSPHKNISYDKFLGKLNDGELKDFLNESNIKYGLFIDRDSGIVELDKLVDFYETKFNGTLQSAVNDRINGKTKEKDQDR